MVESALQAGSPHCSSPGHCSYHLYFLPCPQLWSQVPSLSALPPAPTLASPSHPALLTALRKGAVKARGSFSMQSSLGCRALGRTVGLSVD